MLVVDPEQLAIHIVASFATSIWCGTIMKLVGTLSTFTVLLSTQYVRPVGRGAATASMLLSEHVLVAGAQSRSRT